MSKEPQIQEEEVKTKVAQREYHLEIGGPTFKLNRSFRFLN